MTIDERLEALKQSLELWSHMHKAASKEYWEMFRANEERFRADEGMFHADDMTFRANEERLAQLMDTRERLGRILEKHGQRLDDLDRH
jgi:hypothetical protein